MSAFADQNIFRIQPACLLDEVFDIPLQNPIAVEKPVVDTVAVVRADGPIVALAHGVHDHGVAHERVGFHDVIAHGGEKDVINVFFVDRKFDILFFHWH